MAEGETKIEKDSARVSIEGNDQVRLLALEIRAKKAGFAMFEDSLLLDWGVTRYGAAIPASRRIGTLLDLHRPAIIVTRWRPRLKSSPTCVNVVKNVKGGAHRRSIRMTILD